jgi:TBC1 domain family member 2
MKRKSKRIDTRVDTDPGGGLSPWGYGMQSSGNYLGLRRLSNSADIAIERPAPSHPTAKKSEGKILRPQYKEILRGMLCEHAIGVNSLTVY